MTAIKDPVSGFTHLAGLGFALLGAGWLVGRAHGAHATRAAVATYGLCLVLLYAASALYHLVPTGERSTRALRVMDHAAIYAVIAGTCTPIFQRAFDGPMRVVMLGGIWTAALVGIGIKLCWRSAPRLLSTALYVAMGWAIVIRWSTVVAVFPGIVVALVVAGGVVYTLGAVVYALRWPDPRPRVFGFHEIWHLFVLGGSALHWAAIALLACEPS
jgi:hemolysin III